MGRKRPDCARGVRIRTYPSGREVIEIQFSYKGISCKETYKRLDATKSSSVKAVNHIKYEIDRRIESGSFDYEEFFPNSKRLGLFGKVISQVTVKQAQATILKDLTASKSKEAPTLLQYSKGARVIDGHIGHIRIVDLAPDDIRQIIRQRNITKKTFDNYTIVLKKTLRRMVSDGVIPFNPIDRVEVSDLFQMRDKPRPDPFTLEEIDQVLAAAADHCPLMANMAALAIYTGIRIEELVALQWDDVVIAARKLKIRRAGQISIQEATFKRVKTPASIRDIDLLPRALDALEQQREQTRWQKEWIFHQFTRQQPISDYRQIKRRWTTVLRKAGVRYRPFKQCRHTFASHMLSSGVNRLLVAYTMGHSDTSKLDIYSKWVDDWKGENNLGFGCWPEMNSKPEDVSC